MKEIAKMVHFDHPNVMTLTGVILDEGSAPLLVMPYMAKGTVLTFVRDNKTQFLFENEEEQQKVSTVHSFPDTRILEHAKNSSIKELRV